MYLLMFIGCCSCLLLCFYCLSRCFIFIVGTALVPFGLFSLLWVLFVVALCFVLLLSCRFVRVWFVWFSFAGL